jgi:hypothetical protein
MPRRVQSRFPAVLFVFDAVLAVSPERSQGVLADV